MNDLADLRNQVDRLQKLVDVLTSPGVGEKAKGWLSSVGSEGGKEGVGEVLRNLGVIGNGEGDGDGDEEGEGVDLKANDLAEALSHLALEKVVEVEEEGMKNRFIEEVGVSDSKSNN
jgi:hypothetical protein